MKRLKGILIVVAIFVSGLFAGTILGGSAALLDVVTKTLRSGPLNVRRILVQRAKHDLHLDEDQSHQFWQILNETGADLRDATKPVRPQIDAALAKSASRLRDVLRADQRPRFDSLLKDSAIRWQAAMADPSSAESAAKP